ncbi:EAL domain-containing protein [Skermanella pratensis]|uniref:EAL domain-containing protein n=1 Tax=Skermanella pratensis TaxID=2233999 RepID=UPI0013010879|nr:EAL domain-containing protein [Skermanella pratensis]
MMKPAKTDRPASDWSRVKPGEKPAAAPAKPQHDDAKLLALLHSAKRELQGLRLVHLHLSLLKDKNLGDIAVIRRAVQEISENSAFLQLFSLSNEDIIFLYKGIKFSTITDICQKIERLMLSRTQMMGLNPYREDSLYSIMELSLNFVNVIRFIEGLDVTGGPDGVKARTKPSITLEELARIERQMAIFDLSPFMLNQPVMDIRPEARNHREYFELYIAVKSVEDRLSPEFDITANRWLFNYFTSNLDQSILKTLNYGIDFIRGHKIGLNINLTTVLSAAFVKFDERLTAELRGNVVLEINKVDLIENESLYREVVDFARNRGYSICIDGLTPFWVTHMDLEYMACDYAKVFWSPDMLEMDRNEYRNLEERINNQDNCRFILARCGTVSGLLFAHRIGIHLVQGRIVDNIIRKGVSVSDAINTARVMDD